MKKKTPVFVTWNPAQQKRKVGSENALALKNNTRLAPFGISLLPSGVVLYKMYAQDKQQK